MPPPSQPGPPAHLNRRTLSWRSWWRPPSDWTVWDRFWVKVGGMCITFGLLAHILPLFGLQFRKLSNLGSAAGQAGTGVAVVGVFIVLYVVCFKGRLLKLVLGVLALGMLALIGLLVIGYLSSRQTLRPPAFPLPGGPAQGGPALAGPNARPPNTMGPPQVPRANMPAASTPPAPIDYQSLVTRFGAQRVARLSVTGVEGIDMSLTLRARINALDPARRPSAWRVSSSGDTADLLLAPVDDLESVVAALDLGAITAMDFQERHAAVKLDRSRAVPAKTR